MVKRERNSEVKTLGDANPLDSHFSNGGFSFLPIFILQWRGADERALGGTDEPFLAVGIIAGFANRVVRDDVEDEVFGAVVDDLMRLAGLEDERITGDNRGRAFCVADGAVAGDDVIKFPLGAVGVVRAIFLAGRYLGNLDIEGMALLQIGGMRFAAQSLGDAFVAAGELSFRRGPGFFNDVVGVYLAHKCSRHFTVRNPLRRATNVCCQLR